MLPLYASLERLDHRLLEAAGDLYASPFNGFRKVTFPLSLPGVVAGTLLTFIPAAGDYINSKLLGSTHDDRAGHRRAVPAGARLPDGRACVRQLHLCWSRSSLGWSMVTDVRWAWSSRTLWSDDPAMAASAILVASTSSRDPALVFQYMLLPNVVVILFSFNKPNGRFNYEWTKFSFDAWLPVCGAPGMCQSLGLSLRIGLLATIGATVLGTLVAFALARHRFRGRSGTNLLIFLPMATPEVVMGSSLLTLFVGIGLPLGPTRS